MPKLNTTVKAVRIDNDKLAELEKMLGGRSINSWLNEKIEESIAGKPSEPVEIPYEIDKAYLDDLATMVGFGCESVGEIIRMVDDGLNDGSLLLANGKIVGKPVIDLDGFLEACHDAGADPQKVLDKAMKGIGR